MGISITEFSCGIGTCLEDSCVSFLNYISPFSGTMRLTVSARMAPILRFGMIVILSRSLLLMVCLLWGFRVSFWHFQ